MPRSVPVSVEYLGLTITGFVTKGLRDPSGTTPPDPDTFTLENVEVVDPREFEQWLDQDEGFRTIIDEESYVVLEGEWHAEDIIRTEVIQG